MAAVDQITYWNNEGGARWRAFANRTAILFTPLTAALMRSAAPAAGEKVLDVGCGCGNTVLELARRVAPSGRVVGLDVSRVLLEVAEETIAVKAVANAEVVLADAATYDFSGERFDLLFSQFGVMFFSDPIAAFTNLHRALAPNGRIAFACWRDIEANPWFSVPLEVAKSFAPSPEPVPPGAPGPLAFADGKRVERILRQAGFREIELSAHDDRLMYGSVDAAADLLSNLGPAGRMLGNVDPKTKALATDAIASALRTFDTGAGIQMPAGVWLVTARAGI